MSMNGHSHKHASAAHASGFTLIEVLVALLVLSVGLLGVAKLSFSSVQANGSAYMRTQATELTKQIFDAMRANRNQAALNGYDVAYGVNPVAGTDCSQVNCSDIQMATYDLAQWKARLQAAMPGGDGQIVTAIVALPNGNQELTASVSVEWNDQVAQQSFGNAGANVLSISAQTVL